MSATADAAEASGLRNARIIALVERGMSSLEIATLIGEGCGWREVEWIAEAGGVPASAARRALVRSAGA